MILGIDPKVDFACKHLLGREPTRWILKDLIESVLQSQLGHRLLDILLLNPFNPKDTLNDKLSILDIKARDDAGRYFNIEMQMLASKYYVPRVLYYACHLHQQQLREGQNYSALRPTYSISFINSVLNSAGETINRIDHSHRSHRHVSTTKISC